MDNTIHDWRFLEYLTRNEYRMVHDWTDHVILQVVLFISANGSEEEYIDGNWCKVEQQLVWS